MTDASSPEWIELTIEASPDAVDAIVEVFRSRDIKGVAVEPQVTTGDDEGFAIVDGPCLIKAYVPVATDTQAKIHQLDQALWHLQAFDLAPLSELRTRTIREEDWANAWKEHFHPFRIGRRFLVKPSWREIEPEPKDIILELDPGMAFGTGLHPTTRMVLEALEDRLTRGASVFDVGTGSGILAVAAAKLGAGHVFAVDVDPIAVRVTMENVALNQVTDLVSVSEGTVDASRASFDLVLANIIASVIAGMGEQLSDRLRPDGILVASGIIQDRLPDVLAAFARAGLEITESRQSGDWLCLVARKSSV